MVFMGLILARFSGGPIEVDKSRGSGLRFKGFRVGFCYFEFFLQLIVGT